MRMNHKPHMDQTSYTTERQILYHFFTCFQKYHFKISTLIYSKSCVKRPLSKRQKLVFNANYCLMQVKIIIECSKGSREHSSIRLTFIKLSFVIIKMIKIFVLSISEGSFLHRFYFTPNFILIKNVFVFFSATCRLQR